MTERPILFSAEMVRAILKGDKTQTRRVIKPQPPAEAESVSRQLFSQQTPEFDGAWQWWAGKPQTPITNPLFCPYGKRGDTLCVPETAPRLTLSITNVRVERLQDISEDDARAEGATPATEPPTAAALMTAVGRGAWFMPHRSAFASLWNHIKGPGAWDANPWVWVVAFERVKP